MVSTLVKKFDFRMYRAALAYYGLPVNYNRTFKQKPLVDKTTGEVLTDRHGKPKTTLISCNAPKESAQGSAVWVQVNQPFADAAIRQSGDYTYPKKAANEDIQWIANIPTDFEYPPDPSIAHRIGLALARYIVEQGLAEEGLPVEDTGGGCHIPLPILPIETTKDTASNWNKAVSAVVKKYIQPEFDRLVREAGIEMDLGGFDISRVLSAPGTWRPYRPDKKDCDALKKGYLRRWLAPYVGVRYPERKENAKLAQLIRDEYERLQEQAQTSQQPLETTYQAPNSSTSPSTWLDDYALRHPNSDRSAFFQSLVNATYLKFGEDTTYDLKNQINDLADGKFNGRLDTEFARSLDLAKSSGRRNDVLSFPRERVQARKNTEPEAQAENTLSDMEMVERAIETKDVTLLQKGLPALAQLTKGEYLLYEARIKKALGQDINMTTFSSALAEARKAAAPQRPSGNAQYEKTETGMVYNMPSAPLVLSNFTAEILADITTDDGSEQTRSYEVEAEMHSRRHVFEISAKEFSKCDWIDERLGAGAQITVGQSIKPHLVNAIKSCSSFEERYHYAHTGWREIDGQMVYLHNGGVLSQVSQVGTGENFYLTHKKENTQAAYRAEREREREEISQVSQVSHVYKGVSVKFTGPLEKYAFPVLDPRLTVQAVRASLRFFDLAEDVLTAPLYASLWRAPLGTPGYGIHLAGQSGRGKTQLVGLIQSYYGAEMWNDESLPGSWESTGNALEMLLSQAKDAIVVVDDFKPRGSRSEIDRLHATADRVFRSIGNGQGRARLSHDLTQRAGRKPRCLLISTGEDVPKGQSLKARGVILTMNECITQGAAAKRLTIAQKEARSGLYAQAMAAFIAWLAPRIKDIQSQIPDLIGAEREGLNLEGHARTGTNTANMLLGMKYFLQFAVECQAITEEEAQAYLTRCLTAFRKIADEAARENHHEKPSEQWRRLIIAAIANKTAYLVNANGTFPGIEYGWVKSLHTIERDGESITDETIRGGVTQIGWVDGDDIYLLPAAAYKVARAMGTQTGDEVVTVETTLRKFLVQDKMLASTDLDKARKTITVRRRLENAQRDVLHFAKGVFYPDVPLANSADLPDILDSEPYEVASVAASRVSQVVDSEPRESTKKPDSEPQNVTRFSGNAPHQEVFERFKAQYLQVGTKKRIQWYVPGSAYTGSGYDWREIEVGACIERLRDELASGDEKRIRAAIKYMRTHLRGAGELA